MIKSVNLRDLGGAESDSRHLVFLPLLNLFGGFGFLFLFFWVWGSGFGVWGLGLGIWGLEFWVTPNPVYMNTGISRS